MMENGKRVNEAEGIVLKYNKVAMNYLRLNNLKDSLTLLKKAEDFLNSNENFQIPNRLKLMGITLNNLGCYYKKRKKPIVALGYLEQALEVELQTETDQINIAGSHLNICAILSSLSKHNESLHHAQKALSLLQNYSNTENYSKTITLATSLVISHYNIAVEYEYLNNYSEALKHYGQAYEVSKEELGILNPMTANINDTIKKFALKYKPRETKSNFRNAKVLIFEVEKNKYDRLPSVAPRGRNKETRNNYYRRLSTAYSKAFESPIGTM